jgi:hypothetical protein
VLVHGYIDESYNADIFTLSCLLGRLKVWTAMSFAWKNCLRRWNLKLVAEGRQPLTRYHAKDCGNLKKEFAGWTVNEQRELTRDLLGIFKRHPVVNMSISINMREYFEVFPEVKNEPLTNITKFIYGMMTKILLYRIGEQVGGRNRFTLIYDRGPYAHAMLEAFD